MGPLSPEGLSKLDPSKTIQKKMKHQIPLLHFEKCPFEDSSRSASPVRVKLGFVVAKSG
jgi:hypothetical protein